MPPTVQLARTRSFTATRPIILWHLLSLDAPTAATFWTFFILRTTHTQVPLTSLAAMFLAVWILYAADRLLDARDLTQTLELRHLFHHRHRRLFRFAIAAASIALAPLLLTIPPAAVRLYLLTGTLLIGWFLLIHIAPATRAPHRLPKELAVGLFFAAATFIPTIARRPELRSTLILPAILFATLCSLNCLYIYAWEHPAYNASTAHPTTRLALRHLFPITLTLIAASLLTAALNASPARVPLAIALAAALLLTLNHVRILPPTLLRAAADLILLTPILFLL